jgi:formamidase
VCGTGVETAGRAVIEISFRTGTSLTTPMVESAATAQRVGPALATTGIGPDLMVAARDATRALIDEIVCRTGLSPAHAYILASLSADLVISEIVDAPNWVVSLHLPLAALECTG